jgi:hypothetical protein
MKEEPDQPENDRELQEQERTVDHLEGHAKTGIHAAAREKALEVGVGGS